MELLFEIGCEDLPARFVAPLLRQLEANFRARCDDERIEPGDVTVLGTPRRLALIAREMSPKQADLSEERTGPPVKAAFRDGAPTKAAEGFARGQGVAVEDLYTVETERGEYVAAKVFEEGRPTAELLPEMLTAVINGFSFPKSMRWGANREQFGRPVRWIVALAGGQLVDVEYAGVKSGNVTLGHRFAPAEGYATAPSRMEVSGPATWLAAMESAGVVVDPAERRRQIVELVTATAQEGGGRPVDDPGLVDEVTNLVEQPHAVLVEYDEAYLELPDEVLISSMRAHQRYFGVLDDDGSLRNCCVVVYNTPVRDPKVVAAGNLRVLKARLDDAKFFWNNDLAKPLDEYRTNLETVLWLNELGSMRAKSDRIGALAAKIAGAVDLDEASQKTAHRAGELAKADLVTSVVYEFPDLQGTMGREYALKSGETAEVAQAIGEQYLPRGADEELPESDAGACVALAEKLDSLVGTFLLGLVPTSTADPYGLRRAAIGTIRVLQDRGWTISLDELVRLAAEVYADSGIEHEWTDAKHAQLLDFFRGRLESQLAADFPTDVVRAVLAVGLDDVTSVTDRVAALSELRSEPVFEPLAAGFKRVVNILRKQASEYADGELVVDEGKLEDDAERELYSAANAARTSLDASMEGRDWRSAVRALAGLREPVDTFFDTVMVMTDDAEVRKNRIALLYALEGQFMRVADLSIVG